MVPLAKAELCKRPMWRKGMNIPLARTWQLHDMSVDHHCARNRRFLKSRSPGSRSLSVATGTRTKEVTDGVADRVANRMAANGVATAPKTAVTAASAVLCVCRESNNEENAEDCRKLKRHGPNLLLNFYTTPSNREFPVSRPCWSSRAKVLLPSQDALA